MFISLTPANPRQHHRASITSNLNLETGCKALIASNLFIAATLKPRSGFRVSAIERKPRHPFTASEPKLGYQSSRERR